MNVSAVIVAAGSGVRLKSKIPKALVKINSKPLVIYSLSVLSRHPAISEIILVVSRTGIEPVSQAIKKYRIPKVKALVLGGARRQDSVFNGLAVVSADSELVLVQDAARPFIGKKVITAVIIEARKSGAAIVGVPVKNTIKSAVADRGSRVVGKTIERERLWEIQTPQVFKKELIMAAYDKFGKQEVTDDAALIEKMGKKVSIVPGAYNNIKITTPEDLVVAEAIARKCKIE